MILKPVRPHTLFLIVLLASLNMSCATTQQGMGQGKTQPMDESLKEIYLSVIRDGFTTYDVDVNGFLSRAEYSEFQLNPEVSKILTVIAMYNKTGILLFDEIDDNKDERISYEEIDGSILALLPSFK